MFSSNRCVIPILGEENSSCYLNHCVIPLLVTVQYRDDLNDNLTDEMLSSLSQKTIHVLQGEGSITDKYYFVELYCHLFEHYPSVRCSSDTMIVFQALEEYYSHPAFSSIINYLLTLRVVSKDVFTVDSLIELTNSLFSHNSTSNAYNYCVSYYRLCSFFLLFSF